MQESQWVSGKSVSIYICGHLQKLKTRQSALKKTTALTEEEKQKWAAVMTVEMMSSEESDAGSDDDGESMSTFIKHPLPWCSDKVTSLFKSLDRKACKGQSQRSHRMTQQRTVGFQSERPKQSSVPDWALKA